MRVQTHDFSTFWQSDGFRVEVREAEQSLTFKFIVGDEDAKMEKDICVMGIPEEIKAEMRHALNVADGERPHGDEPDALAVETAEGLDVEKAKREAAVITEHVKQEFEQAAAHGCIPSLSSILKREVRP